MVNMLKLELASVEPIMTSAHCLLLEFALKLNSNLMKLNCNFLWMNLFCESFFQIHYTHGTEVIDTFGRLSKRDLEDSISCAFVSS